MTPNAIVGQIVHWLRTAALILIIVTIATTLLKAFGVVLPFRMIGHVELAYLAGAYWLTK